MSTTIKKPAGYVNAVHVFGRSMMGRLGQGHYLQWQWRRSSKALQTIPLSKDQYKAIKKLLGPIEEQITREMTSKANSVSIHHQTNGKYYMRVKRYLKKEKLL